MTGFLFPCFPLPSQEQHSKVLAQATLTVPPCSPILILFDSAGVNTSDLQSFTYF